MSQSMRSLPLRRSLLLSAALIASAGAGCKAVRDGYACAKFQAKTAARSVVLKAAGALWPRQDLAHATGELDSLGLLYGTDKTRRHHFTEIYEYFLSPLKERADKILEIGIAEGGSLKMWERYFPRARIYGIDIVDASRLDSKTLQTFIADQSDRRALQGFLRAHGGGFDLILDDGGHSMEQQQVSFGFLFKEVKPGGFYIIEDVHTSVYANFGNRYGASKDGKDTTLAMIDAFLRTGAVRSRFMTPEEEKELTATIEYANLFSRNNGTSMTCLFRKKPAKSR